MFGTSNLEDLSSATEAILGPPFEWCRVDGGLVTLKDARPNEGTGGGNVQVAGFAMAKFPITNAQYDKFIQHPNGFDNPIWWNFSQQASRWRIDHQAPKPTAFAGSNLPRTRVSWFDSLAFCRWLSAELEIANLVQDTNDRLSQDGHPWIVRLPTEQEWQRAALGDTARKYPWGDKLDKTRANYGGNVGQPTDVEAYPDGKSIYQVMDMVGNVWEWCVTGWGMSQIDVSGYTYRVIRGGAWNISNPEYLWPEDRSAHPPRGRLNDCGFRCAYYWSLAKSQTP
jgi:formylglycine-generating enzyme required for sulfatase activity